METVAGHVRALREGDDAAKTAAAEWLGSLADNESSRALIAEAGGIPLLVDLLRDGSAGAKLEAARALSNLAHTSAYYNSANGALITEAGGIAALVELMRGGSANAKLPAAEALRFLAWNNDANAVAIALAFGLEALVQLARGGEVIVDDWPVVHYAALPAKRKAALVVSALLRDCVPGEKRSQVQDLIRAVIGPCL